MAIGGVKVIKSSPSSQVSLTGDNISGLILNGVATAGLALGTVYSINGTFDAKALGLSDAYDKANGVLVYYHIKEFYRRTKNKAGTKLWFMLVATSVTLPVMVEDAGIVYAKKLINTAKGEIKQLGFGFNPAETKATGGNVNFTAVGADGDTVAVRITFDSKTITLGSFTKTAAESTATLLAVAVRAAINENTATHGFVAAGSTSNVALTAPAGYGASINGGSVLNLLINGTIAGTVTQFSSGVGYSPTLLNGYDTNLITAIAKAQALAVWAFEKGMGCQMILEGKAFVPSAGSQDLGNIDDVVAPKVTVVSGQDYDKADVLPMWYKHAAIGTFLGDVAAREINQNPAWTEVGDLTDAANAGWLRAGFSNHTLIEEVQEIWDTLDDKRGIFPITYPLSDGIYWNNDYTCVTPETDEDGFINENTIHYGRTADKAARVLYAALFNDIKSTQKVDPTTGKLSIGTIHYFKGKCENRIDREMSNQISGRSVYVDPDSDLIAPPKTLNISFTIVPDGSADTIKVNLGLAKSI